MTIGASDGAIFLSDFAVPVIAGSAIGKGILDAPGTSIDVGGGVSIASTDYSLQLLAADFEELEAGDPITVDGRSFVVKEPPMALDDGTFKRVMLKNG